MNREPMKDREPGEDKESAKDSLPIRALCPEDLPAGYAAITELWTEAGLSFRPEGRDRADRVLQEVQGGTGLLLVAEDAGHTVGVALVTHDGRKGWINRLAVAPGYRRRGIAASPVDEAEQRLNAAGIEIVAALVESSNEESLAFFLSLGYVHDPEIEYVSKRRSPET